MSTLTIARDDLAGSPAKFTVMITVTTVDGSVIVNGEWRGSSLRVQAADGVASVELPDLTVDTEPEGARYRVVVLATGGERFGPWWWDGAADVSVADLIGSAPGQVPVTPSVIDWLADHAEDFAGPQGEPGPQGEVGPVGPQGEPGVAADPQDVIDALPLGEPDGLAVLDGDGRLPESQVPDRLSEAGLSATIATGMAPTPGTPLRAGYDAPGAGADAKLSIGGSLAALATNSDHRLWVNWPGQNVLSIRNTAATTTQDTDSAIKFIGTDGMERGAVGHHNGENNPDGVFYNATFLESSHYIALDGTGPGTENPPPRLALVQTGKMGLPPYEEFGYYPRIVCESDGDINFFKVMSFNPQPAFKIRKDGAAQAHDVMKVHTTSGAPEQLQIGKLHTSGVGDDGGPVLYLGHDFTNGWSQISTGNQGAPWTPPVLKIQPGGGLQVQIGGPDSYISFFGATPRWKDTVSGSRGGNAALESLLIALHNVGLITNSTTA